jgi:ribonuclease T2
VRAAIIIMAVLAAAVGRADTPGRFDHYILALSWHPTWCAAEGDARDASECDRGSRRGFSVHGLWPNHVRGWPEFCTTPARDPTRRETAAMADLMGSPGLAWYQWRKHGRCSGLDGATYLRLTREAAQRIVIPEPFRRPDGTVRMDPDDVEAAFLAANPRLTPEGLVVTCRDGRLHEVRVCLDRTLTPRACTDQEARACRADRVAVPPVR